MRLIDADAMKETLKGTIRYFDVVADIDAAPTIEPKHGKWLKTGQSFVYPDKFRNYFCSVCGFELDTHIRQEPNYCPHCGARMEMERSEE